MSDEPRQAGAQDEQGEQERARAFREQLRQLHAADLGYEMAVSLVSFGSQKLGLSDATAELRDLADAQLAIELLRAMVSVLEEKGGGVPTQELRDTLAQLQLGYVHALQLEDAKAADAAAQDTAAATAEQPPADEPEPPADEPEPPADEPEPPADEPEPPAAEAPDKAEQGDDGGEA